MGGAGYLTFGMVAVFLGIIGSVTMPEIANSEFVVPELAKAHLHPVAIAIFVGLALIIMSAIPLTVIGILPGFWLMNQLGDRVAGGAPDPVMFLSYWRKPEATREKYIGEWLADPVWLFQSKKAHGSLPRSSSGSTRSF